VLEKIINDSDSQIVEVAYLVVCEGARWRDVFRLPPSQVTTVGRSSTNRIVIQDEICSRNHCEVFQSEGGWVLRDLGSRNGTLVDGIPVHGDVGLKDGQLMEIGAAALGFTYDLSQPFPQLGDRERLLESDSDTAVDQSVLADQTSHTEPEIIHRKRRTRFRSSQASENISRDRTSQELASLYRLALDMGAAPDVNSLAEVVLDALFSGTSSDIGAILLFQSERSSTASCEDLQVLAYKSVDDSPYQRLAESLSRSVLAQGDAILARDVADDSRLGTRDSWGEIQARSVICAPVRSGEEIKGVVHLYSTSPERQLESDDLEFTMAVSDQLGVALQNLKERETLATGLARAQEENETLRQQLETESELVGESQSMKQLRENIFKIGPTDATVLIRGESGVGKELVARALHFNSKRRPKPFVCLNCAALSESLLESELFGHEKGAFTGATDRKPGKFEQADCGTLFLDEVGEMSLAVQAKFLRVLEGHTFERVGGSKAIDVNVRVVAATNRDLEEAVEGGSFRKDLYFRLQVVELTVPALREHRDDIPRLVSHFVDRFANKSGRSIKKVSKSALELLKNYDWPGNIRELQNTIERAVILCSGEMLTEDGIQLSALGKSKSQSVNPVESAEFRELPLELLEKEHILSTLAWTHWNKTKAAQILGIERSTLDRKLKRYQISRPAT